MQRITVEDLCQSMISKKLICNFIEAVLRNRCSPVNLLHIFRTPFYKNTHGRLLLKDGIVKNFKASNLNIDVAGMYLRELQYKITLLY